MIPNVLTRASLREVAYFARLKSTKMLALRHWWKAAAERGTQGVTIPHWELADVDAFEDWRNAETPAVSVIIPVYNQIQTTLECLRAIIGASFNFPLELVVVDDASTDAEVQRIRAHGGITYRRNHVNSGFVASCNVGAKLSRGRFLVFLNSDTLVTPGWLEALIARLDEPGVGLVGARLVYPDGRLQEAGGIVFADGSGWNYGRGGHPGDPRYLTAREAHYCSGAVLALTRERFQDLGGFDPLFAPGYYEDTDLAMRVRASGARVVYEPKSVVVHLEGASAGTDITRGMKSAQPVNRGKFHERWRDTLHGQHPPAKTDPDLAVRQPGRGWVVAHTAAVPDSRLLTILEALAGDGCAVDFFLEAELPACRLRQLRARGVTVWPPPWNATGRWLLARIGWAAEVVLTDGSARSDAWCRQRAADLPTSRWLRLATADGPAADSNQKLSAVTSAKEILALLEG